MRTAFLHSCLLTGIAVAGGWVLFYTNPALLWGLVALAALAIVGSLFGNAYLKRMKAERADESICSFARSLPARKHDTWVVRAVYEELTRSVRVPVRPTDDLERDLRLHPDDRDDIAFKIARRAGRSMENTPSNPLFDRVKTVADIVVFFEHQPKVVDHASQPKAATGRG